MKWKRGFKRITLVMAILAGAAAFIIGWSITESEIHREVEKAKSHLQSLKNREYDIFDRAVARHNVAKAQNIKLTEMRDKAFEVWKVKNKREIEKEMVLIKQSEIANAEKNFWLNSSTGEVSGMSILAGLIAAAIGFCVIWLIYYLIKWLILGFADEKITADQNK